MLISILGPTATGKTALAVELARLVDGEIISADSRQVYRELTIGSGKDLEEYGSGTERVPYHLIDICTLDTEYNLFRFLKDFYNAYADITKRGKTPILCGGTGLYLAAVFQRYNPVEVSKDSDEYKQLLQRPHDELKLRLIELLPKKNLIPDLEIKERTAMALLIAEGRGQSIPAPEIPFSAFFLSPSQEGRRARIKARLIHRLKNGMIEEVEELLASGVSPERLDTLGLEYRYITKYILGELDYREMEYRLFIGIADFSKRQMTWFRKMMKDGIPLIQIDDESNTERLKIIKQALNL